EERKGLEGSGDGRWPARPAGCLELLDRYAARTTRQPLRKTGADRRRSRGIRATRGGPDRSRQKPAGRYRWELQRILVRREQKGRRNQAHLADRGSRRRPYASVDTSSDEKRRRFGGSSPRRRSPRADTRRLGRGSGT